MTSDFGYIANISFLSYPILNNHRPNPSLGFIISSHPYRPIASTLTIRLAGYPTPHTILKGLKRTIYSGVCR